MQCSFQVSSNLCFTGDPKLKLWLLGMGEANKQFTFPGEQLSVTFFGYRSLEEIEKILQRRIDDADAELKKERKLLEIERRLFQ